MLRVLLYTGTLEVLRLKFAPSRGAEGGAEGTLGFFCGDSFLRGDFRSLVGGGGEACNKNSQPQI